MSSIAHLARVSIEDRLRGHVRNNKVGIAPDRSVGGV